MFVLLAPQRARHSSGFVVQIESRTAVSLTEPNGSKATAEIEFGPTSTVYKDSLQKVSSDGAAVPLSDDERNDLAAKMLQGLQAMGGDYEVA